MTLTKKQKILGAVLGAAVAVFVGDRVLLGLGEAGPAKANASPLESLNLDLESLLPRSLVTEKTSHVTFVEERTLADRLETAVRGRQLDPMAVRDAFSPSEALSGELPVQQAPLSSTRAMADAFAAGHKLTATVVGPQGGLAIIDGQCLAAGKELDGFRLVSVKRDSAEFICEGVHVTLRLPTDPAGVGAAN